jgi:hypothetical protein
MVRLCKLRTEFEFGFNVNRGPVYVDCFFGYYSLVGVPMMASIALIAFLAVLLMVWLDWYTAKEFDRKIEKFFEDQDGN